VQCPIPRRVARSCPQRTNEPRAPAPLCFLLWPYRTVPYRTAPYSRLSWIHSSPPSSVLRQSIPFSRAGRTPRNEGGEDPEGTAGEGAVAELQAGGAERHEAAGAPSGEFWLGGSGGGGLEGCPRISACCSRLPREVRDRNFSTSLLRCCRPAESGGGRRRGQRGRARCVARLGFDDIVMVRFSWLGRPDCPKLRFDLFFQCGRSVLRCRPPPSASSLATSDEKKTALVCGSEKRTSHVRRMVRCGAMFPGASTPAPFFRNRCQLVLRSEAGRNGEARSC